MVLVVRLLVLRRWDVNLRPASGRWQKRPSSAIARPSTRNALASFTSRTSENIVVCTSENREVEQREESKKKTEKFVFVAHLCVS